MYEVLLLTDFSLSTDHVLAFTQALFAGTAIQFCLLHTFSIQPTEGFTGPFLLAEQRQSAEVSLYVHLIPGLVCVASGFFR